MAAASYQPVPFFVCDAGAILRRHDIMPLGDHGRWQAAGAGTSSLAWPDLGGCSDA